MLKHARLRMVPRLALLAAVLVGTAAAQDKPEAVPGPVAAHAPVESRATVTIGGARVRYTARVEGLDVEDANGKTRIVSFAYVRDGVKHPEQRPVTFLFNGGPIVASIWVHLGGIGPYRVAFPDDVTADPSTFKVVPNEYSPLDATDLVFVDPASTGWSRVAEGTKPEAYFGTPADGAQFVAFIQRWLQAHGRTASPVYVFGESYGTNRAAEIATQVAAKPEVFRLKGVFLYGQAVNIIEYSQRAANVTSYAVSLPTLAAIASYHGKADRGSLTQEQFIEEAQQYGAREYLLALFQGSRLPQADRERVAARLERYTGLPAAWYLAHDLKITKEQYRTELFADRKLLLGRADARYVAPVGPQGRADDPSDVLPKSVAKLFEQYRRDVLHVDWPEPYFTGSPVTGLDQWNWGVVGTPFSDWPYYRGIGALMAKDPEFRVTVANGRYDTQTTMGAAALLTAQSGWDPARVTLHFYDGGHMGYSVAATARAIGEDIRALVR